MITGLRGVLEALGPDWVVLRLGGVSVRVSVPASAIVDLGGPGATVQLHTHLAVREDSLTLYGFATAEALQMFEMLVGVTGIGPRLALALLSGLSTEALAQAIASEDADTLAQVPGVGKRTAARISLELKGRIEKEWGFLTTATGAQGADDVSAALLALGYTAMEARRAVAAIPPGQELSLEDRVRMALRHLVSQ